MHIAYILLGYPSEIETPISLPRRERLRDFLLCYSHRALSPLFFMVITSSPDLLHTTPCYQHYSITTTTLDFLTTTTSIITSACVIFITLLVQHIPDRSSLNIRVR
ncbi:hypothetical protein Tco_1082209 [Tanacetum coccineum]|uniref:Uncharacterized protein n=1 Tax=Tanacetum coccineum TaxID=301880 RepID=A0ABQ5I0K2_9ASTR